MHLNSSLLEKSISASLTEKINCHEKYTLRPHYGVAHGVNEITKALRRLSPHKNSVAFILGGGNELEELMIYFSKEGMSVISVYWKDLKDPKKWVEELPKDCVFVAYSEDNSFSSELYPYEELQKEVEAKRLYSIAISYSNHLVKNSEEHNGFRCRIMALDKQHAVSQLGSRCKKLERLISANFPWKNEDLNLFNDFCYSIDNFEQKITAFELESREHIKAFFSSQDRVFDRAALLCEGFDSFAMKQYLEEKLSKNLDGLVESSSLCQWGALRTVDWFRNGLNQADEQKSLLLISVYSLSLVNEHLEPGAKYIKSLMGSE